MHQVRTALIYIHHKRNYYEKGMSMSEMSNKQTISPQTTISGRLGTVEALGFELNESLPILLPPPHKSKVPYLYLTTNIPIT